MRRTPPTKAAGRIARVRRDRYSGPAAFAAQVKQSGLLPCGGPLVVLLSGGRDSVCLLHLAVKINKQVRALHVNYGLRPSADEDERFCASYCHTLGVGLHIERPQKPASGNTQAWAREVRYSVAQNLAGEHGLIATAHTATDQVETVLYRLVSSPGRRALLGMKPRIGNVVRPLLQFTRMQVTEYNQENGLSWQEDPTNQESEYARNRIRNEIVPALRTVHPAAEQNVLSTVDQLQDEAELLDELIDTVLDGEGESVPLQLLSGLSPALARLVLQRMVDELHPQLSVGRFSAAVLALDPNGTKTLDIGSGIRAVSEYGRLRFEQTGSEPDKKAEVTLAVPGEAHFAGGMITTELVPGDHPITDGLIDMATITLPLTVRQWQSGDKMKPLGLNGTRSLQDLFTDRKIPRAQRARLPLVLSGKEIVWIPAVATAEKVRVTQGSEKRVLLSWTSHRS